MGEAIPNRGPQLYGINIAFLSTAVIAYGLRVYVRVGMVKGFKHDDWLMGFALLFFIAYCTSSTIGVHHGTGRHYTDLTPQNIRDARHAWYFCYIFYCSSMICSKISIGYFLLRIAVQKIHTWIIYMAMIFSTVSGIAFFLVTLLQCRPISYFWDTDQDGFCVNITAVIVLAYFYSALSIITDFTFALLPTLLIANLQLKRKTKIALIPLLTMGCIASSAVVARLPYLIKIGDADFLWSTFDVAIWSTVEQGLAITAGSLATVRPLFSIILCKLGFTSSTTRKDVPVFGGHPSTTANQITGGRGVAHSRDEIDMHKLSSGGDEESGPSTMRLQASQGGGHQPLPPSSSWLGRIRGGTFGSGNKEAALKDDGSEKSLKDKSETESFGDERAMQIMVSKSFVVSDGHRKWKR
ncbi:hypothetical protein P280DRAFT_467536 [Massarina eburnea CBS 473.64]|uniref:Rhodopsin domain-containing protein n=1 Tax=Massarina eburnea CBS 473.64 TaxID=1395130 RepID=A0A6A6SBH2_9PLEO|nr:hypothetical protein P280DRAFT_467536 [Massarina eburnea CBS 473.64]